MEPNLGLFENRREANLTSTIDMVEDVLVQLGHFLNECRVEAPEATRAWRVTKGSASVRIALVDGDEYAHLLVVCPVMTTDARVDTAKLHAHLLRLNYGAIRGAAFGVRQNEILIVSERSTLDLDRSEVFDLIKRVQDYADDYDDLLVREFGGKLGGNS